ncbi:MAG: hypothetical protein Q9175_000478 [Cornicularia normoerica]
MDGKTGDPMANDEPQQSRHSTSAFSDTDASSLALDGLDPTSVQARMQGWQPSRNDETLPSIEQDDQPGIGRYRSLFTAQAVSTVLEETANDTVGAAVAYKVNQDGSSHNPLFQQLQSFQSPQPFQDPYVHQSESLQTPQPLRNLYIPQPARF